MLEGGGVGAPRPYYLDCDSLLHTHSADVRSADDGIAF